MKLSDEAKAELGAPDAVEGYLTALQPDAAVLSRKLNVASRAGLIREMCLVALSAGGASEIESGVLIALARMLEISPDMYSAAVQSAMDAIPPAPPTEAKPKRKRRSKTKKTDATPEDERDHEATAGQSTASVPTTTTAPAEEPEKGS